MAWFLNTGSVKFKLWSLHLSTGFHFFAIHELNLNYGEAFFIFISGLILCISHSFILIELKLTGTVYSTCKTNFIIKISHNIPIYVPGVHYCQKYVSAGHQVPANQKSIQFFRQYTRCYQHSTIGRLNYGPQSFETCIT